MENISNKILFICLFFLVGCANLRHKEKILGAGILSFGIGSAVGYTHKEQKVKNALLYGGGLGFLALLLSSSFFSEEETIKDLENKIKVLEEDFGLTYEGNKIKFLTGGKSYLTEKNIPKEFKEFIDFGQWSLYELQKDYGNKEWVFVGNNRLIKGNKMFELTGAKVKEEQ